MQGIWPSTFHFTATLRSLPKTDRTLFVVLQLCAGERVVDGLAVDAQEGCELVHGED